ncbi:hypothetical protein C8J56DRAFT_1006783 [Mycena floridula]|nr:hypothetical protein C8J56DRAFT_1006783 [Mycena floridula]
MRLAALSLLSLIQVLQVVGLLTAPPYDPSPYTATGYITDATVNNASDVLSGGTLTFNNRVVIIPDNLLVNTPSLTAVAWSEMFNADGRINLPLWPQVSWEASIFANFINGQYIAGIVYIFQELGNLDQGFITHIDYDLGEMRIGGDFKDPNTGVRLVINDPIGRFGKVHGDWPLWTADTENPSVVASTGFPMCLPRVDPAVEVDPLCPITNRPVDTNGNFADIFTFDAPPVAAGQPDPTVFAPLVVGLYQCDFVTFSATTVPDSNGEHILAAYSIEANLGFYTTPGTRPAYLRISTLQAGINGGNLLSASRI